MRAFGIDGLILVLAAMECSRMPIEQWLAFAAASAVLVAIPGPTVLLVVSYSLGHGRRSALATVVGVALGDVVAISASLLGLGALLAASAELLAEASCDCRLETWVFRPSISA